MSWGGCIQCLERTAGYFRYDKPRDAAKLVERVKTLLLTNSNKLPLIGGRSGFSTDSLFSPWFPPAAEAQTAGETDRMRPSSADTDTRWEPELPSTVAATQLTSRDWFALVPAGKEGAKLVPAWTFKAKMH